MCRVMLSMMVFTTLVESRAMENLSTNWGISNQSQLTAKLCKENSSQLRHQVSRHAQDSATLCPIYRSTRQLWLLVAEMTTCVRSMWHHCWTISIFSSWIRKSGSRSNSHLILTNLTSLAITLWESLLMVILSKRSSFSVASRMLSRTNQLLQEKIRQAELQILNKLPRSTLVK